MKKLILGTLAASLLVFSCQKKDAKEPVSDDATQTITKRNCASMEVLEAQMAADPSLKNRMQDIENFTARSIANGTARTQAGTTLTIPVIVHLVYNTAAQNISDAQIQSQIDVLNEDFSNTNLDGSLVPPEFTSVNGNMDIKFVLSPVKRIKTNVKSWSTNDAVKSSKRGGSDAVDPSKNLNIWVCNLGQGLLGYAQFPGGKAATDGIVVLYSAFGSSKKYPSGTYTAPYDLGRTATHEVGHWLNLRHIWGDTNCGSDLVNDTPVAHSENYGCPSFVAGCIAGTREMTMNYMDYTDDKCMYMFTKGQKTRADAIFVTGGARASFVTP